MMVKCQAEAHWHCCEKYYLLVVRANKESLIHLYYECVYTLKNSQNKVFFSVTLLYNTLHIADLWSTTHFQN